MKLSGAVLGMILVSMSLVTTANAAEIKEVRYLGYATEQGSGRYLYTETHRHRYQGNRWLGGHIRYVAPDGRVLGEKTLDFSADPYVPVSHYRLTTPAYEEHIVAVDSTGIRMEKLADGKWSRKTLPRVDNQAADSGFNAWLVDRLDQLARGDTLSMRLAVVGQLDQYRFRVRPSGRTTVAGEPALRLKVEPDSLLRLLVSPLEVVYGLQSRDLLHYRGVSNIIDPVSGKAWSVNISYRDKPPGTPATLPTP